MRRSVRTYRPHVPRFQVKVKLPLVPRLLGHASRYPAASPISSKKVPELLIPELLIPKLLTWQLLTARVLWAGFH